MPPPHQPPTPHGTRNAKKTFSRSMPATSPQPFVCCVVCVWHVIALSVLLTPHTTHAFLATNGTTVFAPNGFHVKGTLYVKNDVHAAQCGCGAGITKPIFSLTTFGIRQNLANVFMHFTFDEGQGKIARESAGGFPSARIIGDRPFWTANGKYGAAICVDDAEASLSEYLHGGVIEVPAAARIPHVHSISFFVKRLSALNSVPGYYIAAGRGVTNRTLLVYHDTQSNSLLYYNLLGTGLTYPYTVPTASLAQQYTTWQHVVLTTDGWNRDIYIDGVMVTNQYGVDDGLTLDATDWYIGSDRDGLYPMKACIDDLRIYGFALTKEEVLILRDG